MCTAIRFTSSDGSLFFGRNLDLDRSFGERVLAVPAGFPLAWRHLSAGESRHAIIGMGICPSKLPLYFDCANDAGLAIAGLNFPQTTRYLPAALPDKTNIASFEFMLWVCATFDCVDAVEAALQDVAITAEPFAPGMPPSPLHWMIADSVRSIVVEQDGAGLHVYRNSADVLTNEPNFAFQETNLRNYLGLSVELPAAEAWGAPFGVGAGLRGIPGDYYSTSRFVKAACINANYPQQADEAANVARLFRTLGAVAMPLGAAKTADGAWDQTIYQAGFSAATQTYYHSTYNDPAIRKARLADCAFAATDEVLLVD